MLDLVNIDVSSDVANNLIDKMSEAVGWFVTRDTPNKIAQATYIKEIQESNLQPLEKAAMISNTKKIIKEYSNQVDIVHIAMQNLEETAKPDKLEDDWLALFMDKAKLVSSEEFQLIWGKVLAYECNNPNSIPKVLLNILSMMDNKDAEAFNALSNLSVQVEDEFVPIIDSDTISEYRKWGITLDNLVDLQSLWLINMETGVTDNFLYIFDMLPAKIKYFDTEYQLQYTDAITAGSVLFTKSGMALRRLIQTEKVDGFWEEYCLPQFINCDTPEKKKR